MWDVGTARGKVIRVDPPELRLKNYFSQLQRWLTVDVAPAERECSRQTALRLLRRCSAVNTVSVLPSIEGPKSNGSKLVGFRLGQDAARVLIASDGGYLLGGRSEVLTRARARCVSWLI